MISERLFCRSYASFWRDLLPFSETVVRDINRRWTALPPDRHEPDSLTRAVVNEGSVRLYRRIAAGGDINGEALSAVAEAASWLGAEGLTLEPYEFAETVSMARYLLSRYGTEGLTFGPRFRGCGILLECEADFISDRTLVEVKSGHRAFRSPDLRQVLVYSALNFLSSQHDLDRVELCNARLDRVVGFEIEPFCMQLSGESSIDIFGKIADFLSGGIISGV